MPTNDNQIPSHILPTSAFVRRGSAGQQREAWAKIIFMGALVILGLASILMVLKIK